MVLAEELPPDASIASTGLTLRTVGNYCYAYSGVVGVDAEKTLLEFNSGALLIRSRSQAGYPNTSGDDFTYRIYFNNIVVYAFTSGGSNPHHEVDTWIDLIVPPFTRVKLTAENLDTGNERDQCFIFTGRLYDSI